MSEKIENKKSKDLTAKIKKYSVYILLAIGALVTIFPVIYTFILASRSRADIFGYPPPMWFGDQFMVNFRALMAEVPFIRNILNTIFMSTVGTLLTLFFCSLGGYGFAKYDFKGKNVLFFLMLATMMIPATLAIIPWYIMMDFFGWINTFYPFIIPGAANAFGIFLMTQFMKEIPDDIIDAARIDGCGEFEIFLKIALPLSLPGLGTLAIFSFMGIYNNYIQALLVLESDHMLNISVALSRLSGRIGANWGAQLVGAALGIAPIVIAFLLASKQFISGLTAGARKG